jgi:NodT family efflux transporter outer membrane factor (OMF) lipoprotein
MSFGPLSIASTGALLAAILLSSCAVGPDFVVPAPPDVGRYTKERLSTRTSSADSHNGRAEHFVNGRDVSAEWWQLFRSPALNSLIRKSLAANPNLQSTMAALRVAKENVYAAQGAYFPAIDGNFNPTRQQLAGPISPTLSNGSTVFNLYTTQVLVSYTFDAWGLNRRTVEGLQGTADFQRFQAEAAYLTLISNVVVAAIQEASLRAQIEATDRLIAANERMLGIVRQKFDAGAVNRADVAVQEAAVAQTRATLPPLRKALAVQRDLLTALAGRFPSQEPRETFRLDALLLPADLPLSLPSQLVEQRPDVRAAEEQLHTASANVGVAIANMLPSITLSANRGYQATDLASLFQGPNIFWTVAGNVTQPLFHGFTLLHQERSAQAAYEQAAWTYQQTVITAFQNVADALRAIQNDADALKANREFERAAKTSLDVTMEQFNAGQIDVLLLLTAQVTYQQAVLALVQAEANRLSDAAALFQALGGGWWNRDGPPSPEQKLDVATGQSTLLTANTGEDGGLAAVFKWLGID